jgi:hypothetical protein
MAQDNLGTSPEKGICDTFLISLTQEIMDLEYGPIPRRASMNVRQCSGKTGTTTIQHALTFSRHRGSK